MRQLNSIGFQTQMTANTCGRRSSKGGGTQVKNGTKFTTRHGAVRDRSSKRKKKRGPASTSASPATTYLTSRIGYPPSASTTLGRSVTIGQSTEIDRDQQPPTILSSAHLPSTFLVVGGGCFLQRNSEYRTAVNPPPRVWPPCPSVYPCSLHSAGSLL